MQKLLWPVISLAFATAAFTAFAYFGGTTLIGTRPEKSFEEFRRAQQLGGETSELQELRRKVSEEPSDVEARHSLALALLRNYPSKPGDINQAQIEAAELLRALIAEHPDFHPAYQSLGNLAFEKFQFPEAIQLFQRSLELRYVREISLKLGLSQALIGDDTSGLARIESEIEKQPDDFEAHSYKTIVLIRSGRREEAKVSGDRALALAPDENARKKLTTLLDGLRNSPQQAAKGGLEKYFISHPIIGPKLIDISTSGDGSTMSVFVKEFPVEAMPPIAKQKLEAGIKAAGASSNASTVQLRDADSQQLLLEFSTR